MILSTHTAVFGSSPASTHRMALNGQILAVVLVVVLGFCESTLPPHKCKRTWKKVGCFHDRVTPDRPLPNELVNIRDPTNPAWNGFLMEWAPAKYAQSLHALACECNRKAKELGNRYFGLQFWGECWSGPSLNFARDGPSTKCKNSAYKPCDKESEVECVGKAFTNYIYDTEGATKDVVPVPGGWGEWTDWTICSKSCAGGVRTRERFCDNPEPQDGGAECEGDEQEEQGCNEEECVQICTKKVEIGIILDASTSVSRRNYDKMLQFMMDLSDKFTVNADNVHFGALHYSWRSYLDWRISDQKYWNNAALKTALSKITYTYGGTRTDKALYMAEKALFCDKCGLRQGVPRVLIVVTDGISSRFSKPMKVASANLKVKQDVKIISIGVTNAIDEQQLKDIASSDDDVLLLHDFKYLIDKINTLAKKACRTE